MATKVTIVQPGVICGGFNNPYPANKNVEVITSWMQRNAEAKTGANYKTFKAVECISQVVAGMNFLIKVHVGGDDYVHLNVVQGPLLGDTITVRFRDAKGGYKKNSPLNPDEFR